jgi:hypothetical protein
VPPAQGEAHLAAALHELVVAKQTGTRPLTEVVERHRELTPAGAAAALLLSTTEVDLEALASTIGSLRASTAHPIVIVVDALAFPPVDRPPTPIEVVRARRSALVDRLLALDVPSAVLGPEDTPEDRLVSPDFLSLPRPAEAVP